MGGVLLIVTGVKHSQLEFDNNSVRQTCLPNLRNVVNIVLVDFVAGLFLSLLFSSSSCDRGKTKSTPSL